MRSTASIYLAGLAMHVRCGAVHPSTSSVGLAFGRGLDPDDLEDVDEMRHLNQALARMLSSGGKYYDFMACAP